jgi:ornithine carbamoyltransferase
MLRSAASHVVLLNLCPPFEQGKEVSADAVDHGAFVDRRFEATLLLVHQAIMTFCVEGR